MKFISFLFVFGIPSYNFSQISPYKPFPQTYAKWEVTEIYKIGLTSSYTKWSRYQVAGDTTIGAFTYKKVNVAKNTGLPSTIPIVIPYGTDSFAFAYRNDILNKKIYLLDPTNGINKDTLWYDFNLNIGDTLKSNYSTNILAGGSLSDGRYIIQSIDSIQICGVYHKRFNFGCSGFPETSLIEGYGFKDFFKSTLYASCPFENNPIFSTEIATCIAGAIKNESKSTVNAFSVYPNPSQGILFVNSNSNFNIEVLNQYGEIIQSFSVLKGENYFDISKLVRGIYFLKGKNGDQIVNEKIIIHN